MNKRVKLECPTCKKKSRTYLDDYDPPNTYLIKIQCMDCAHGNKPNEEYYDRNGNLI